MAAPSVSAQLGVRWNNEKPVTAAAVFWYVVRGKRVAFETGLSPPMGAFWSGVKRQCVHGFVEKCSLLITDVLVMCVWGEVSLAAKSVWGEVSFAKP